LKKLLAEFEFYQSESAISTLIRLSQGSESNFDQFLNIMTTNLLNVEKEKHLSRLIHYTNNIGFSSNKVVPGVHKSDENDEVDEYDDEDEKEYDNRQRYASKLHPTASTKINAATAAAALIAINYDTKRRQDITNHLNSIFSNVETHLQGFIPYREIPACISALDEKLTKFQLSCLLSEIRTMETGLIEYSKIIPLLVEPMMVRIYFLFYTSILC
jgi:Ca2+-binding EF-hand superfamily protein